MKLYNKKVYECEHCGRISKSAGGMAIHEKTCRKNPNVRPMCWGCRHFYESFGDGEKEAVTFITFNAWGEEYTRTANMRPSRCDIDRSKLYNRIGVHCEELAIALQDEGWKLCPTVSEGCPDFETWPESRGNSESSDPFNFR